MELGEKLRQARLKAGLSQRQLCGGEITRNMLSQIEHGTSNPSVSTLCFLARRLGLPVSYFLEEDGLVSSNGSCMADAWAAFEAGDPSGALSRLEEYRGPDDAFDREYALLKALTLLSLAEREIRAGRKVHGKKFLNQARELEQKLSWLPEIIRRRMKLEFRLGEAIPEAALDSLDETLLIHGAAALEAGSPVRAAAFLDACQDREGPDWCLLRARIYLAQQEYAAAAKLLQRVEEAMPETAVPLLEQCFSALGDYRLAYHYACKQRKGHSSNDRT